MKIVHRYIKSDSQPDDIRLIRQILDRFQIKHKYEEDLESVISSFKYSIKFYLYEEHNDFLRVKSELNNIIKEQIIGTEYEKGIMKIRTGL